jgi:hypothetical protein
MNAGPVGLPMLAFAILAIVFLNYGTMALLLGIVGIG